MRKQDRIAVRALASIIETAEAKGKLKVLEHFDCSTKVRLLTGDEIVISAVGVK